MVVSFYQDFFWFMGRFGVKICYGMLSTRYSFLSVFMVLKFSIGFFWGITFRLGDLFGSRFESEGFLWVLIAPIAPPVTFNLEYPSPLGMLLMTNLPITNP